jgi:hypothetical protein
MKQEQVLGSEHNAGILGIFSRFNIFKQHARKIPLKRCLRWIIWNRQIKNWKKTAPVTGKHEPPPCYHLIYSVWNKNNRKSYTAVILNLFRRHIRWNCRFLFVAHLRLIAVLIGNCNLSVLPLYQIRVKNLRFRSKTVWK